MGAEEFAGAKSAATVCWILGMDWSGERSCGAAAGSRKVPLALAGCVVGMDESRPLNVFAACQGIVDTSDTCRVPGCWGIW